MGSVGFCTNLVVVVPGIKGRDIIAFGYGGGDKKPRVSPVDMVAAVAEDLTASKSKARKKRYVANDELGCNEIARILGTATFKSDLQWRVISDEQMLVGLKEAAMSAIRPGFCGNKCRYAQRQVIRRLLSYKACTWPGKNGEFYYGIC